MKNISTLYGVAPFQVKEIEDMFVIQNTSLSEINWEDCFYYKVKNNETQLKSLREKLNKLKSLGDKNSFSWRLIRRTTVNVEELL